MPENGTIDLSHVTRIDFIAQEKLKKLENVQFSLSDAWENTEFGMFLDENGMIGNFFELQHDSVFHSIFLCKNNEKIENSTQHRVVRLSQLEISSA